MGEAEPTGPDAAAARKGAAGRMILRLAVVGAVAFVAHSLIGLATDLAERLPQAGADMMLVTLLLTALALYAVLIAIPFVPGIEIGLALLLLRGASIAPGVYLATLAGLMLAYAIGRLMPEAVIIRLLSDLRLRRAADLVARHTALSPDARRAHLEARLPPWCAVPLIRYRYVTLGLLLNLPGNVILGGGGGIMVAAGLSRQFRTRPTLLMLAIAVLPVPLLAWGIGPGLLS